MNTGLYIVLLIVSLLIGSIIGKIFGLWLFRKDGVLVIDISDPDKDVYRLEIYTPFDEMKTKKTLILRVRNDFNKSRD